MVTTTVDHLMKEATRLTAVERVQLIQRLTETLLIKSEPTTTGLWRYGAFSGDTPATLADFALAEWHPTDEELNGA